MEEWWMERERVEVDLCVQAKACCRPKVEMMRP